MLEFENIRVAGAVEHIRLRREQNRLKLEENNRLVMDLVRLGRLHEARRLIEEGASRQVALFAKAEECENCGDLEEAARLLWENIYAKGADATVNFVKLMEVLRRLGCCEGELKVAEVFLHFTDRYGADRITKRIEEIRRMMAST